MARKTMTKADYEKIINGRLIFGKSVGKVAEEIDCGEDTVTAVTNAFTACQRRDWKRAAELIEKRRQSLDMFAWCCEKLEIEMPRELRDAYERACEANRQYNLARNQKKAAVKQEPDPPAPATNDALYFCKLLEALNRQNELLTQLMDVVLPKWIGDLKENNNVNTDLLNKQLQLIDQKVECIKVNTRKRGL